MHKLARIIAAVFAFVICAPSLAADKTWQGGGTQDANNRYLVSYGDNWSGGVAPAENDKLIFGETGAGSVSFDAGLNYGSIYFNGGTYDGYNCVTGSEIWVCQGASTTATLRKQDGDWAVTYDVRVGEGNGSLGTFQHSGGTLNIGRTLFVGSANSASAKNNSVTIDGGTVYVNGTSSGNYRAVALGFMAKSTGMAYLTVSGTGRLVVTEANNIWIGRGGAGYMTIADDAVVDVSNGLVAFFGGELARDNIGNAKNENCVSFLYLNGGTLLTQCIKYGASDPNNNRLRVGMYFNGGTLKATADSDSFIKIPYGNVRVQANGGTIDTNGHTINVQETLDPPSSGTSGDLVITGGGTYTQTGVTAYNGRTIVDGNTKYIKNNASSNLKLVVKAGSSFQNAATLASRVAGASLTFEDGAKLVVEPTRNQIAVSAPAIDVQGALTISSSPALPPEGAYTLMQITGTGTFAADILSRISFENAPAGLTLVLSEDRKSIGYTYYAHDWSWTGAGDGTTFGDSDNWHCKAVPGATSDLYFSFFTESSKTLQNDIDDLTVRSIVFNGDCASLTISGKQISMAGGGITNELNIVQTFTAPVAFPDDVGISAKQNILMNNNTLNNEAGRIVFTGGVRGMQNAAVLDNRVFCGHWRFMASTVGMNTATDKRTTIYKNSSLEANTLEGTQALYVMSGAAVTAAVINVTGACLATYNYGEIVVTNTLSFPASTKELYTTYDGHVSTARVKARKLVLSGGWNASLGTPSNEAIVSTVDWYLGEDGMNVTGSSHFFMHHNGDVLRIHPWKCDTAINQATGSATKTTLQMNKTGSLEFYTDDEDGVARTISLNGIVSSVAGAVTYVKGAGTLSLGKSQRLAGGVSVVGTAQLKVAKSGTVSLGGDLTLADGATLGFALNGDNDTTLAIESGKTLTVNGTVAVKFAEGSVFAPDKAYTLVSGANLAEGDEAKFALPEGNRGTLSVVEGNLVYTAPKYFIIKVK